MPKLIVPTDRRTDGWIDATESGARPFTQPSSHVIATRYARASNEDEHTGVGRGESVGMAKTQVIKREKGRKRDGHH